MKTWAKCFSIAIVVIVAIILAVSFRNLTKTSENTSTSQQVNNIPATNPGETPLTADGKVDLDKLDKNGPWNRNLIVRTSNDGKTWGTGKTFIEAAGVPSITKKNDGTLIAAFQWFTDDAASFDRVAISTSSDNGATWSDPTTAIFADLPETYQRPFDPTVVTTEDDRIRIYFTSSPTQEKQFNDDVAIYSAISNDGITYTFEPEPRLDSPDVANYDSAAAYFNAMWYLITPNNSEEGESGTYSATSGDGVTFIENTGYEETEGYNWTGNLTIIDDLLTFFGTASRGNIWYAQSSDGITWSDKNSTNVRGGDPAVVEAANGTWLMISVE